MEAGRSSRRELRPAELRLSIVGRSSGATSLGEAPRPGLPGSGRFSLLDRDWLSVEGKGSSNVGSVLSMQCL